VTGCLFISPGVVPALIADCLVTTPGVHQSAPATLTNGGGFSGNPLFRKIYILSKRTAIAVSGEGPGIEDFLATLAGLVDIFELDERPMRRVGDFANQYAGKVQIVGASVCDRPNGYFINQVSADSNFPILQHLGQCASVGSGAEDLMRLARAWDPQFAIMRQIGVPVHEVICGLAGAQANGKIIAEYFGLDDYTGPDWGGYVEYAYFDYTKLTWRMGEPRLHLLYIVSGPPGSHMPSIYPFFIAYDPGLAGEGELFCARAGPFGQLTSRWRLNSLLAPTNAPPFDWNSWAPERASVTFVFQDHPPDTQVAHLTTDPWAADQIIFDYSGPTVRVGMTDDWLAKHLKRFNAG
jgi:hypothetical protein